MSAISSALSLSQQLRQRFEPIEDFSEAYQEWGFKVLPITGAFMRSVNFEEFISRLKAALPRDARLLAIDDIAIRPEFMRDVWTMVFGSKEWPLVGEREALPRLEMLFLGDRAPTGTPDTRILGHVPVDVELVLTINKRTHSLVMRKEDETEDALTLRIQPF